MDWQDCSEVVIGLVFDGKEPQGHFVPELFYPNYEDVFVDMIDPKVEKEDLIIKYGNQIQACVNAANSFNGVAKDIDWRTMLLQAKMKEVVGAEMEKRGKHLREGRDVDVRTMIEKLKVLDTGGHVGGVRATDLEESELQKIKSGWAAIDTNLGGYPEYGLVVVAGREGTGKTTMIGRLATSFINEYPDKDVEIFTLEMLNGELLGKIFQFDQNFKENPELRQHIILNENGRITPEEIAAEIATWMPNLGLVIIDYADLLVREKSDDAYGQMYDCLMKAARENRIPIIAFAQFKTTFSGGVPHPEDIYFIGTARKNAWNVWCIWSPGNETGKWNTEDKEGFPSVYDLDEELWLLAWKQRGGWLESKPGPMGICMQKEPRIIWPTTGRYFRYSPQNAKPKKKEY
jgi:hypothetical protein